MTGIENTPSFPPAPRHPLLVIVWTFGLFVLVHTTQYLYIWLASISAGVTFSDIASGRIGTPSTLLIRGVVGLLLGVPATILATRFLWRRRPDWMRTHLSVGLFGKGCALGFGAVALVVAGLWAGGFARLSIPPYESGLRGLVYALFGLAGWALFTAILEEYVFRGMAARELAARWGWPLAALVGGAYFAATHLMSIVPLLTPGLALGILVAGIVAHTLFLALYVRSSSLWFPIGFHASWNFALSGIIGTTMSGRTTGLSLLRLDVSGPSFLTGGSFGIETSAFAVVAMALMVPCILFLFRRGRPTFLSTKT